MFPTQFGILLILFERLGNQIIVSGSTNLFLKKTSKPFTECPLSIGCYSQFSKKITGKGRDRSSCIIEFSKCLVKICPKIAPAYCHCKMEFVACDTDRRSYTTLCQYCEEIKKRRAAGQPPVILSSFVPCKDRLQRNKGDGDQSEDKGEDEEKPEGEDEEKSEESEEEAVEETQSEEEAVKETPSEDEAIVRTIGLFSKQKGQS